ncbi:GNAT family N-acetyltransferase [Akkermansiaceae bacterium]|nr:GNAT family N-acetyltransferase [Akkermansiaceae bacterium]
MNGMFLRKVAISLLLAPLFASGLSFPDEILVDGPVASYRLDETAGTVSEDSSGMGQVAAYAGINAPTLGLTGFLVDGNKAIEMSGSGADASYVLTPGVLNPATTSFTLEAVVQTDAIGARQMVFQQRDVNGTGRTLLRVSATGEVDSFIGGATRRSGISVAAGEPLHLVMVFERTGLSTSNEGEGTVIFYVNGVKGNSIAMNGSNGVEPSDGEFVIGTQKGRMVMKETETLLLSEGVTSLELHARENVVGFYEKIGFQQVGSIFSEIGIPHVLMKKGLGES